MAVLGYLPKLKRGLGLAFGTNIPYLILYQVTKFFPSQDLKQII